MVIESGETKFVFRVDKIGNNNTENYKDLDYWVVVTVEVNNRFFKYSDHGESLEYGDLIYIRDSFEKLLSDRLSEKTELSFIEPDFEFVLFPKFDLRTVPGAWCKEGHEIQDISVDFIINLTESNHAYSGEQYILPLNRQEITKWRDYLNDAIVEFDARRLHK